MLLNEDLKREYGVIEYNTMPKNYHDEEAKNLSWNELIKLAKNGEAILSERIRFVTDPGFPYYDLSYWHVRMKGVRYRVINSPFEQLPKKGGIKNNIYTVMKNESEGVFIKDLFDNISILQ